MYSIRSSSSTSVTATGEILARRSCQSLSAFIAGEVVLATTLGHVAPVWLSLSSRDGCSLPEDRFAFAAGLPVESLAPFGIRIVESPSKLSSGRPVAPSLALPLLSTRGAAITTSASSLSVFPSRRLGIGGSAREGRAGVVDATLRDLSSIAAAAG